MTDEKNLLKAKEVYDSLCTALDKVQWKYQKRDDDLIISFTATGDDLPMGFVMAIDARRQLIRLSSALPFDMPENKRVEGAIATCFANFKIADGSFDYNLATGEILFRMTACFKESLIGEDLFHYMVHCACSTVDRFNDQFFMMSKDKMSLEEFFKEN